jgi:hypothetical protein
MLWHTVYLLAAVASLASFHRALASKAGAEPKLAVVIKAVIIPLGESRRLAMSTKESVQTTVVHADGIVRVAGAFSNDRFPLVTAVREGKTAITLIGRSGAKEHVVIIVPPPPPALPGVAENAIVLRRDTAEVLRIASKRAIQKIANDNPLVVQADVMGRDRAAVQLKGLAEGSARVSLIDIEGDKEEFVIIVWRGR